MQWQQRDIKVTWIPSPYGLADFSSYTFAKTFPITFPLLVLHCSTSFKSEYMYPVYIECLARVGISLCWRLQVPPDSKVGILCSEPVRGEGTQSRTGKSPCDELTVAFLSAAVGAPNLISVGIWGLSHKLNSTGHATEVTCQEQSRALCKGGLRATACSGSLLKPSEPPATCDKRNRILCIPELAHRWHLGILTICEGPLPTLPGGFLLLELVLV